VTQNGYSDFDNKRLRTYKASSPPLLTIVDKMVVDKMVVDKMVVDKMVVDKMVVDYKIGVKVDIIEMSVDKMT
jgi:hypothetical protein